MTVFISSFLLTRFLLVPYAYVSIEWIDCILLSSFQLNAILLTSSIKTLCISLLNLFCVFNNDLLFLMNCFLFFLKYYLHYKMFHMMDRLRILLICRKVVFSSQDIQVFAFLATMFPLISTPGTYWIFETVTCGAY